MEQETDKELQREFRRGFLVWLKETESSLERGRNEYRHNKTWRSKRVLIGFLSDKRRRLYIPSISIFLFYPSLTSFSFFLTFDMIVSTQVTLCSPIQPAEILGLLLDEKVFTSSFFTFRFIVSPPVRLLLLTSYVPLVYYFSLHKIKRTFVRFLQKIAYHAAIDNDTTHFYTTPTDKTLTH